MSITIHPYKGYINTKFQISTKGEEKEFKLYKVDGDKRDHVSSGKLQPNVPQELSLGNSGYYSLSSDDGEDITFYVEDGYKFGGGKFKKSFIFDNMPWCFVIMEDRTYFYNRVSKEYFIEPISPDKITVISEEFILIENNDQEECTVFSLEQEKPVWCVSNIITYNETYLVWLEAQQQKKNLCIASLKSNDSVDRFEVENFVLEESHKSIFCHCDNSVFKISLKTFSGPERINMKCEGRVVGLVSPNIVISYKEGYNGNILYLYNSDTNSIENKIELEGHLAEINDFQLIDLNERQDSLSNADFVSLGFPEITAVGTYHRLYVYLCSWDLFYTNQTITLSKTGTCRVKKTESSILCSLNTSVNIPVKDPKGQLIEYYNSILFYNDSENYSKGKLHRGGGYNTGRIYKYKEQYFLYNQSNLFTLSKNGYWDNRQEIDLDFSEFSSYKIVFDTKNRTYKTLNNTNLGKFKRKLFVDNPHIQTENYYIFKNGRMLKTTDLEILPNSLTESLAYGLRVNSKGLFLCKNIDNKFSEEQILNDVFDTSEYHNVLLSEDGKYVLYRDSENSILMDIEHNISQSYANTSYIKHINGIRPLFSTPSSLQPRLINPINGQYIDCNKMTQYQFLSPDEVYYADTRLNEYVEYYFRKNNEQILQSDYRDLLKKYRYPVNESKDSTAWKAVINKRKELVLENFDYLNTHYQHLFHNDKSGKLWSKFVLDENNDYGTSKFLDRIIGERGIAVIRKKEDNSVYARINLGDPLLYINYVAFSQDSTYVAIAGYRSSGGLLLMYNLKTGETIVHENTGRAVWNVAFSSNNAFASYTSTPYTFFAKDIDDYKHLNERLISGKNFLTFSPDGMYFALSQQSYISKYDKDGNVRFSWGHSPSSMVEVRKTCDCNNILKSFSDIGQSGISETLKRESVASVSFANDNSRLMMVGVDGVIIIRNLRIE